MSFFMVHSLIFLRLIVVLISALELTLYGTIADSRDASIQMRPTPVRFPPPPLFVPGAIQCQGRTNDVKPPATVGVFFLGGGQFHGHPVVS